MTVHEKFISKTSMLIAQIVLGKIFYENLIFVCSNIPRKFSLRTNSLEKMPLKDNFIFKIMSMTVNEKSLSKNSR